MEINTNIKSEKYAVKMTKIIKIFDGEFIANNQITFQVKKNTVHALIGENGAGKSILMSILFGLFQPDSGTIEINNKIVYIDSALKAIKLGIGMVAQHFKLIENFTVFENIILGIETTSLKWFLKNKQMKKQIKEIQAKYNLDLNLNSKIKDISVGERQKVEILKVLYSGANIIVFDEPTSILNLKEVRNFLTIVKRLRDDNKTIIFITHKFAEIMEVCDYATVIRNGKWIGDYDIKKTTIQELLTATIGNKKIQKLENKNLTSKKVVLEIKNLFVNKLGYKNRLGLKNFNLKIHAGEIVAIAGISENGQEELAASVVGKHKPCSGEIIFQNRSIENKTIAKRYNLGFSYIPENRQEDAIIEDWKLFDNLVLQDVFNPPYSKHGFINFWKINIRATELIKKYNITGGNYGNAVIGNLSGGNQQKAVVGRELERNSKLLVAVHPTIGLDIKSVNFLDQQILQTKNNNCAVLLISYDLNEIFGVSDRIIVLSKGKQVADLITKKSSKEEVGNYMVSKVKESDNCEI